MRSQMGLIITAIITVRAAPRAFGISAATKILKMLKDCEKTGKAVKAEFIMPDASKLNLNGFMRVNSGREISQTAAAHIAVI